MSVRRGKGDASAVDRATRVALARFIAIAGVASSLLLAAILFVSAFVRAVYESIEAIRTLGHEEGLDRRIVASVRHADVLLIGSGLLVIGIGLYSIFIERVERLPPWLAIRGFEDLKKKLTSVVVVALAVDFFTVALEWKGSSDIMAFGAGIAAVLLGLSAYELAHRAHARAGHAIDEEGRHAAEPHARRASAATRSGTADRDHGDAREGATP